MYVYTCLCATVLMPQFEPLFANIYIHLVARFISRKCKNTKYSDDNVREMPNLLDNRTSLLQNMQDRPELSDNILLKKEIHMQLLHLDSQVQNINDNTTLRDVRSCITSAIHLIKAQQQQQNPFSIRRNEPSNKLIKPQRPFFSTKKKRRKPAVRITKPTEHQKSYISTALLEKGTLYRSDSTMSLPRNPIGKCTAIDTCNNHITCLMSFRHASLDL